ncbi:hypothetical protein CSUI_007894, partial [Cystoisospora suis]
ITVLSARQRRTQTGPSRLITGARRRRRGHRWRNPWRESWSQLPLYVVAVIHAEQ